MLWLPSVTSIFSLPCSTVWVSSFLIFVTRSWRTSRDSSFFTRDVRSFSAWKLTSSLPILSSNDSMLKLSAPPFGLLRDLTPLIVLLAGSVQGGIRSALYTLPTTIGRLTSPSRKSTITSWPIRGMWTAPHCWPAQNVATRTQQELLTLSVPTRSQWNWTFTRPYLSGKISSPEGPTTVAVCTPRTLGTGVTRGGRKGSADGMQVNPLVYLNSSSASAADTGCSASCCTLVITNAPSSEECLVRSKVWPAVKPACPPLPRISRLERASACMRIPTVRVLSSKTFCSLSGCSPPDLLMPSKRLAYPPGYS